MKIPLRTATFSLLSVWCCGVAAAARSGVSNGVDGAASTALVSAVVSDDAFEEMQVLAEAIAMVRKYHIEEKTYRELVFAAVEGVLSSLDEHSSFLEPDQYDAMQDDTEGRYGGVGIHIGLREGVLTVIAPIEGTPGFRAGLCPGDRIVRIDGETTIGIEMREAVNRLRGPVGEAVVMTIRREGVDEVFDVEVVREEIEVSSVRGGALLEDGIAYVRITQFAAPTADALGEELDRLGGKGMKALVLDLRSNPGGLFKSAVKVAEMFLERRKLVVTTRDRGVGEVASRAFGIHPYVEMPLAVLVNGGSASASEIVAGALKDHRRAILVGERTFGKGSVQSIVRLPSAQGAALRLTTARYFTPSGTEIHGKGIEPDVAVYLGPGEWRVLAEQRARKERGLDLEEAELTDRQLERALDLLKAVRVFQRE